MQCAGNAKIKKIIIGIWLPRIVQYYRRKCTCTHEQIFIYSIIRTISQIQTKPEVYIRIAFDSS